MTDGWGPHPRPSRHWSIEAGAGAAAGHDDEDYRQAGATVVDAEKLLATSEALVTVAPPSPARIAALPEGSALIGFLRPVHDTELARALAERRITALAMELVPRIGKAQAMDALSSQAGIAGYKAVLIAANTIDKLFPLSMTAAGTVKPARVVVVDLAAEDGGNCELTASGEPPDRGGTKVVPAPRLAAAMPREASALYARNVVNLLARIVTEEGSLDVDADPELVGFLLARGGEVLHEPTAAALRSARDTSEATS
ncbi:MAG TPA: hypothetical protein K8V84_22420 [Nocardiopsis listeri]|uniref:hypothetical protein n=1 Tax=Nocardiopsis listeri TaxID=53440 RepID=UPI001D394390|nr:hypothetical protein [Nocardiopsis listeri]HJE61238.1 hypothetical protein [Nocardiopsis listeri]